LITIRNNYGTCCALIICVVSLSLRYYYKYLKLKLTTNDSNATPAPTQEKQESNKGVKKGTVRGPYRKKNQEIIENTKHE
jgi:hypothetical protein